MQTALRTGAVALAAVVGAGSTAVARSATPPAKFDREAFLAAIAEVETGGDARAIGRNGERGMYQFRRSVWRQYTRRSFFDAHNPTLSYYVALKHFDWLFDGFIRNGKQPTPYLMAAAWNGGLTRVLSGRLPSATRSYATRVSNIVAITAAPRLAAIEAPPRFVVTQ